MLINWWQGSRREGATWVPLTCIRLHRINNRIVEPDWEAILLHCGLWFQLISDSYCRFFFGFFFLNRPAGLFKPPCGPNPARGPFVWHPCTTPSVRDSQVISDGESKASWRWCPEEKDDHNGKILNFNCIFVTEWWWKIPLVLMCNGNNMHQYMVIHCTYCIVYYKLVNNTVYMSVRPRESCRTAICQIAAACRAPLHLWALFVSIGVKTERKRRSL